MTQVLKTVLITPEQDQLLKKDKLNLSKFVRDSLNNYFDINEDNIKGDEEELKLEYEKLQAQALKVKSIYDKKHDKREKEEKHIRWL